MPTFWWKAIDLSLALIGPLALLATWQMLFLVGAFSPTLLPAPLDALSKLVGLLSSGDLLPDLLATLGRMAVGYLLASIVGVSLGLLIGSLASLYRSLEFIIEFFRSLPVTALYPLFVLFFGIGSTSKVAMIFVAAVFVVTLSAAYGVRQAHPMRRQMAELFGASRAKILVSITFPSALPSILVGMRLALSYSLIVAIVTEMFMGSAQGLGQRIFDAYTKYATAELFALVIATGALGYLLNRGFVAIEDRYAGWTRSQ